MHTVLMPQNEHIGRHERGHEDMTMRSNMSHPGAQCLVVFGRATSVVLEHCIHFRGCKGAICSSVDGGVGCGGGGL